MPTRESRILPIVAAAILAFAPISAAAEIISIEAVLSGSEQVPPVAGNARGLFTANYDTDRRILVFAVTYEGLSGSPTAAHFHGPAELGVNAGVALPFEVDLASPIMGSAMLTEAQAAEFLAGHWYVNIHTAANPGGEIRSQIIIPADQD